MNAWKKTGKFLVLSAMSYLVVLGVTGELHVSSRALAFFSTLWFVQAAAALWQAWRHPQGAASTGTSAADDIPPAG
jgi:hypothetical protein